MLNIDTHKDNLIRLCEALALDLVSGAQYVLMNQQALDLTDSEKDKDFVRYCELVVINNGVKPKMSH